MNENTTPNVPPEPGGFAQLSVGMLKLWPHLEDHHRLVLPALLSFFPTSFPKHRVLGLLVGRGRKAVRSTLEQLCAVGLLIATARYRPGRGGRTSNLYALANVDDAAVRGQIIAKLAAKASVPSRTGLLLDKALVPSKTGLMVEGALVPSKTGQRAVPSKTTQRAVPSKRGQQNIQALTDKEERERGADAPGASRSAPVTSSSSAAHGPGGAVGVPPQQPTSQTAADEWEELDTAIIEAEWEEDEDDQWAVLPMTTAPAPVEVLPVESASTATAAVSGPVEAPKPVPPPPALKTAPAPAARKGKKVELTDADKVAICASAESMERYLLYGVEAVRDMKGEFPPGQHYWRHWRKADGETFLEKVGAVNWELQHFTAFYWFRVSNLRAERNTEITLPNWGLLTRKMKELFDTMTKAQLVDYLNQLTLYWDEVRCVIGTAGWTMVLNETTVTHSLVRNAVAKVQTFGDKQLGFYTAKVKEEWGRMAA